MGWYMDREHDRIVRVAPLPAAPVPRGGSRDIAGGEVCCGANLRAWPRLVSLQGAHGLSAAAARWRAGCALRASSTTRCACPSSSATRPRSRSSPASAGCPCWCTARRSSTTRTGSSSTSIHAGRRQRPRRASPPAARADERVGLHARGRRRAWPVILMAWERWQALRRGEERTRRGRASAAKGARALAQARERAGRSKRSPLARTRSDPLAAVGRGPSDPPGAVAPARARDDRRGCSPARALVRCPRPRRSGSFRCLHR